MRGGVGKIQSNMEESGIYISILYLLLFNSFNFFHLNKIWFDLIYLIRFEYKSSLDVIIQDKISVTYYF
jgi:hypothetical protein